ncbi:MAG: hypothetical protein IH987_15025 [Planctomycetes bacterium]|nr:hypothetical protein [Planctomycetota bacterium]
MAPKEQPVASPSPVAPKTQPAASPSPVAPKEQPVASPSPVAPKEQPVASPSPMAPKEQPVASPSPVAPKEQPVALPVKSASREEIDRKITAIYGVHQEGEIIVFRTHNPGAKEVQLAGDFNVWMPHTTPMRSLVEGDFEARMRLPRGRYRYRLVIDGRWSHDTHNPIVETNDYGELNSIAEVSQ